MNAARIFATFVILVVLTLAAVSAGRIGSADYWARRQTLSGTENALRSAPDQASNWVRLALLTSDEDPERAMKALDRALALNPRDARTWIDRGLQFEARADLTKAEESLLRAAAVDHQYLPAWSLANYYFRHRDAEKFWFWIRQASGMVYGDPSPLFQLCWNFTSDGGEIERRLGILSPYLQSSYLAYLLTNDQLDAAVPMAKHLAEGVFEQSPLLLEACERLLQQGRARPAMEIWNLLAGSSRFPYERLAPEAGLSLTNGGFSTSPVSLAFDWHLPAVPGVTAAREENPGGIRLSLSGDEPERCEIATQFLPVSAERRYKVDYLYMTKGLAAGSGLGWRILAPDGMSTLAASESLFSEQERDGELSFTVPARCQFVRLVLSYQRNPGTTPIEGVVRLRRVNLTRLAPQG